MIMGLVCLNGEMHQDFQLFQDHINICAIKEVGVIQSLSQCTSLQLKELC